MGASVRIIGIDMTKAMIMISGINKYKHSVVDKEYFEEYIKSNIGVINIILSVGK